MSQRQESQKAYKHYYGDARPDESWPDEYDFVQIKTLEELEEALGTADKWFSLDTETDGLLHHSESVIGFSFTPDTALKRGYYAPIRHLNGLEQNLDPKGALDILMSHMKRVESVWYFNYPFDARQLRHQLDGYDLDPRKGFSYGDTQVACYLMDTNCGMPGLKAESKRYLGIDMEKFESVLGEKDNLAKVSPEIVTPYAAADAIATAGLRRWMVPKVLQECRAIFQLDNRTLYPMMLLMEEVVEINTARLNGIEKDSAAAAEKLRAKIYAVAGRKFLLTSAPQVRKFFEEQGVDTGVYSEKTGNMSCGEKALANCDHPVAQSVVEYRKLVNVPSKFTGPLKLGCANTKKRDGVSGARFSYKTCAVSTGRFAGGQDAKNDYFTGVNIQGVTKPKPALYFVTTPEKGEFSILGHGFVKADTMDDDVEIHVEGKAKGFDRWIEGFDQDKNIRSCFGVPKGYTFLSLDYSGEEARLAANMSGERSWIRVFLEGGDLHTMTAAALGISRKKAKVVNFGIIYGATKWGLAYQLGIPRDEKQLIERGLPLDTETAEMIVKKFQQKAPTLFNFINEQRRIARSKGFVYTHWGRPRRLRFYYASEDRKMHGYADRCVFNTKIQGTAGDILRKALIQSYFKVYEPRQPDILWRSTVHDEINWAIREPLIHEIGGELVNIMRMKLKGWPVPLEVGISIGNSWGDLMEFDFDDQTGQFQLASRPIE